MAVIYSSLQKLIGDGSIYFEQLKEFCSGRDVRDAKILFRPGR